MPGLETANTLGYDTHLQAAISSGLEFQPCGRYAAPCARRVQASSRAARHLGLVGASLVADGQSVEASQARSAPRSSDGGRDAGGSRCPTAPPGPRRAADRLSASQPRMAEAARPPPGGRRVRERPDPPNPLIAVLPGALNPHRAVIHPLEIRDQPRPGRRPAEPDPRPGA
jgi:hypothetical protein